MPSTLSHVGLIRDLAALLRTVEWIYNPNRDAGGSWCEQCDGEESEGHTATCALAAALRAAEDI